MRMLDSLRFEFRLKEKPVGNDAYIHVARAESASTRNPSTRKLKPVMPGIVGEV